MKWKCAKCGELVDEEFEICWNCQQAKPESPTLVQGPPELAQEWADNFQEKKQPDGAIQVTAFGHRLTCGICDNKSFRKRRTTLAAGVIEKSTTTYICSRCGYIFSFLPR